MSIKVFFLNLLTTGFRLWEWGRVVVKYYPRSLSFFTCDLLLGCQYLLKSPHQISKQFLKERGVLNVYQFGETPLTTLDKIAKHCGILSKDRVYELGCGSGRTCFWLKAFIQCEVRGIDYLPTFILKANWVKKQLFLRNIHFIQHDFLQADFSEATVVYLYGTCLEDPVIQELMERFRNLPTGSRVISVSYPLTDYCEGKQFKLVKAFSARYPWGVAPVFINQKI